MRMLCSIAAVSLAVSLSACTHQSPVGASDFPAAAPIAATAAPTTPRPVAELSWPVPHPTCVTVQGPCQAIVPPPHPIYPGEVFTYFGWEDPNYPPTLAQCNGGQPVHNRQNFYCQGGDGSRWFPHR